MVPELKTFQTKSVVKSTLDTLSHPERPFNTASGASAGSDQSARKDMPGSVGSADNWRNGANAQTRLALAFVRLIKAIASPAHPLVILLDDLQWIKAAPLEIVSELLKEPEMDGFMLLGTCRDNEVDATSYLSVRLRELEVLGVLITEIGLTNLDETAVTQMIRDQLAEFSGTSSSFVDNDEDHVDTENTRYFDAKFAAQMATFVWNQTRGNVFFTQLLLWRFQEQLLALKVDKHNFDYLAQCFSFESARALLVQTIRGLPNDVQNMLKLASCFGAEFEHCLIEKLAEIYDTTEAMKIAKDYDLVEKVCGTDRWRFLHDQIHQSAYSLIPVTQREKTHLDIGRRLWNQLTETELKDYGFAVVRQLSLGSSQLTDIEEKYKVQCACDQKRFVRRGHGTL